MFFYMRSGSGGKTHRSVETVCFPTLKHQSAPWCSGIAPDWFVVGVPGFPVAVRAACTNGSGLQNPGSLRKEICHLACLIVNRPWFFLVLPKSRTGFDAARIVPEFVA
ncbi:MAG: hypothetical protein LBC37_06190 [Zoogloeaceae bacterium]|jgi:hypothetical protein|nr:hypothetical protein [Zoogloeaceae bacterium]